MEVIVSYNNPRNIDEWNALCKECGNFVQTTMYSEISAFYGGKSIYIQVVDVDILVGAVKLNLNESRRLSFLSRRLGQFGEIVVAAGRDSLAIVERINSAVEDLIQKLKPCVFTVNSFYGSKTLLCSINKYKCRVVDYGLAYLDLKNSEEELFKNIDRNHRRSIRKAEEANLEFLVSHDPQYVIDMLKETYSSQDKTGPNPRYVETSIKLGEKYGVSFIGVTKLGDEVLSANEALLYGGVSYLTIGGNKKNNCGAFEHWYVIKMLKELGCKKFTFGQVAVNNNIKDTHFTNGITDFKMKFGCYVVEACKKEYIIKPFYNWIWSILCRMFFKKK